MGDPRGQLSHLGKVLGLVEPFFQMLPLPELFHHLVETLGQFADLVPGFHRHGHRQIAAGDPLDPLHQSPDGHGVSLGQKEGEHDAEHEKERGGKEAAEEVVMLNLPDVVQQQVYLHIPKLLVSHDDRYHQFVGLQGAGPALPPPPHRLEAGPYLLQVPLFPHQRRVGGVDDLTIVVDDINLVDPLLACLLEILLEPGILHIRLGGQILHAELDRLGDLIGALLDLTDQVVLTELVQDKENQNGQNQQRQHHHDQFGVEFHCCPHALIPWARVG